MFKVDKPRCPECNEPAMGMHEFVQGLASLEFDSEGNADYGEEAFKVDWDSCLMKADRRRNVTLECHCGATWLTAFVGRECPAVGLITEEPFHDVDQRQAATELAESLSALLKNIGQVEVNHGYYADWVRGLMALSHWRMVNEVLITPKDMLERELEMVSERMDAMGWLAERFEGDKQPAFAKVARDAENHLWDVVVGIQAHLKP